MDVDTAVLLLFNEGAQRSRTLDVFLLYLLDNTPFKGVLFSSLMWWAWFRTGESKTTDRQVVLSTILASVLSLSIGQLLQQLLPFRLRPVFDSTLNLKIPYTGNPEYVVNMNSFPSDHAALFYALAMGFWFLSRHLGAFLLMLVTVFICLPRIIVGYHFPTDVIGGALIGVGTVYFIRRYVNIRWLSTIVQSWENRSAGTLYVCFFLFTYLISTLFDPIRSIAKFILSMWATVP